jgi:DNA-binding MarR family transcriptional regulator
MTRMGRSVSEASNNGASSNGEQDTDAILLNAVGPAFSKLRRGNALAGMTQEVSRRDMTRTLVLSIVEEGPEATGQEITIGVIADRLGVDPSMSSRMVSDCISTGLVVRSASQLDGRRTILELTPAGVDLLDRFRRHQRAAFEHVTRDWPVAERVEFARLVVKYADALTSERLRQVAADK